MAPHGIKGWVKLKVFTETPDSLLDYPTWWLNTRTGWQEFKVAEAEWRNAGLAARFEDCNDRNTAETLKGLQVGIPRNEFPEPEQGEHYWTDLIGLAVVNKEDELLGLVDHFFETGANDVMVVVEQDANGESPESSKKIERLVPYIDSVIMSVDLEQRRIVVDWGLDY